MSFSSSSGYAGNDCYTLTVGNGADMDVVFKYKRNGAWQTDFTTRMDFTGRWQYCLTHTDSGIYEFHAIRNALNTAFFDLPTAVRYTILPPQPASLTVAPSSIQAGRDRSFTMTANNGAGVTADVQYTIDGGSTQTLIGWPSLEPVSPGSSTGQVDVDVGPCTVLGSYVFTGIRNTRNTPWVSVNAPIRVTAPPSPTVTAVAPSSGQPGNVVDVTFTGTNLCDISLSTSVPGITFSDFKYDIQGSGETASARIHLASSTPVGTAVITLTAAGGSTTFNFQVTTVPLTTSLSIAPLSGDVVQGSSREFTVALHPASGFTSPVALSVSDLEATGGLTGSFSPTSVSSSAPSSTLTIAASATATLGNDAFTITGTGGGLTLMATATAAVIPDDPVILPTTTRLSVLPLSGDVVQGSSREFTVTLHPATGFTSPVSLSVSGLGPGLTGSFSPSSVSSSAPASTLTIAASATASLGDDEFTIRGTGGGQRLTATATATVTAVPDFSLSVSPRSRDIWQGTSAACTVEVTRPGGFSGPVELSIDVQGLTSAQREGVTASFSDASLEGSETTSTLTIALSEDFSSSDRFYVIITGRNGEHDLRRYAVVIVTAKQFNLEISPPSREITRGSAGTYELALERATGFTSPVALSVSGLRSGLTGSFSDTSLEGSETASTLTITAGTSAATGSSSFTVNGTGGGRTHVQSVTVIVNASSSSPQPTSLSFDRSSGYAGNDCYTMTVGNGANMDVVFKYKLNEIWQDPFTAGMDSTGRYQYCLHHNDRGLYEFYSIRNALNADFVTLTPPVTYEIRPPQPTSLTITPSRIQAGSPGPPGSDIYRMTVGNGAGVTLDLQATLNGDATPTIIGWPSLEPAAEGSTTGQADIVTGPCTAVGSYVFTGIRNTLNTPWVSFSTPIEVTAPPAPVVTTVNPSSGQKGTSVEVTLTGTNLCDAGFSTSIPGITFSDISYDDATGTSASVRIHLAANTPFGTAVITLTATGGSTTFNFEVTGGTRLSVLPSSGDVMLGSSQTYTVTLHPASGFTSPVSLSVSDLGTGLMGSFSPTSVSSTSPASTLTITAGATAALGNDEFTITGTGGGQTFTITATATIIPDDPVIFPTTTRLSVLPLSGDVVQGSSREFTVTLHPASGFTSPVALSVSDLVAELTGSFSPTSVSSSAPASTLTITASSTATLGNDEFTIRGTGGGQTFTATATATVIPVPDFSLSVAPSAWDIWQGTSVASTVEVTRIDGFSGPVNLSINSIQGLPAGQREEVTASFSDDSLEGSETTSTLTIALSEDFSSSDPFYVLITGINGEHDLRRYAVVTVTAKQFNSGGLPAEPGHQSGIYRDV